MNEPRYSELVEDGRFPEARSWEAKEWVPIASDRVDDFAAVTCVQRVTAQTFYSLTVVCMHEHGRWTELFENGDDCPIDPRLPRPAAGGFAMLTGVSGAGGGEVRRVLHS